MYSPAHSRKGSRTSARRPSTSASTTPTPTATALAAHAGGPHAADAEADDDDEVDGADDDAETVSLAPSEMSLQWFQSPRERLGLGGRVSRSGAVPWLAASSADDDDAAAAAAEGRRPVTAGGGPEAGAAAGRWGEGARKRLSLFGR